jgi:hypothetical protein
MPNMPEGPLMRMVLHVWTAKQSEVMKNPAIRELAGYNLYSYSVMNPVGMMEKMFPQMPGFGDAFAGIVKELKSGGTPAVTRMQMEMFVPMIATMLKRDAQTAAMFGGFDGDSPLMTMTQDLTELSSAAVADSVFQIPEGYKSVPPVDIIKTMFTKATAGAKKQ